MPPKKKRRTAENSENSSEDVAKTAKDETEPTKKFTKWLMKSEPESRFEKGVDVKFGIEDLKESPDQTTHWDGVRNYQKTVTCGGIRKARNYMRDQMKIGELAFFYHSNCKEPGIAGIMKVVKESYVDHTQFDKADPHYDPKASKDKPKWYMVDVKYVRMMKRYISLKELRKIHLDHKQNGGPLKSLSLFTQSRLSVAPLTEEEFEYIQSLEDKVED